MSDPPELLTGRTLGEFVVGERIGRGGFADVYRAHQRSLDREAVVKVLRDAGGHPGRIARFEREARLASQLDHPYAAHVYAFGSEADGLLWIALELVRGTALDLYLADHGPIPLARFVSLFDQLCEVVYTAHASGLVHRDIKPANVMVIERAGRLLPKLLDFGIARPLPAHPPAPATAPVSESPEIATDTDTVETTSGVTASTIAGTPGYMAPEQWTTTEVDHRADIYALGLLAHECLTGVRPGGPAALDPSLPPGVAAAIARALAEAPEDRHGSALELAAAVRDGVPDLPATPLPLAPRRRRRWLLGVAVAAVAAIAIAVGVYLSTRGNTAVAGPACDPDPAVFAGRWDPIRRAALEHHLRGLSNNAPGQVERMLAAGDATRRNIETGLRAICEAAGRHELTAAQASMRSSCLERRAYLFAGMVDWGLGVKRANDLEPVLSIPTADCADITAPPIVDRAAAATLWKRYAHVIDAPMAKRADLYAALERDAKQRGEVELEVRAAYRLGMQRNATDQLDAADEALSRAATRAGEIRARGVEALAQSRRSTLAFRRGDIASARALSQIALDLASKPSTPDVVRATVYFDAGRAELQAARYADAAAHLEKARTLAAAAHSTALQFDALLMLSTVKSAAWQEHRTGSNKAARELVDQAVALARSTYGEHSIAFGNAILQRGDLAEVPGGGLDDHRKAVAVFRELFGPTSYGVVVARAGVANDLQKQNHYEAARGEYAELVKLAATNQALSGQRAHFQAELGRMTFGVGRYEEGARIVEQALESFPKDSSEMLYVRRLQITYDFELGRLDDATFHIAELDKIYRAQPKPPDIQIAYLHGVFEAELARAHGKPRTSERLTRAALRVFEEAHGDRELRAELLDSLGEALIQQRRWGEARGTFEEVERIARAARWTPVAMANLELDFARIDVAEGKRADAKARIDRARPVLEAQPGMITARKRLDELVGQTASGRRRR